MAVLLAWLTKIATHPLMAVIIIPAVRGALENALRSRAATIELRSAVRSAKDAKTVEELKEASRRLTDSSRR